MKNIKTNILLLAMFAASPILASAQASDDADSTVAKKKVHVAFRDIDADRLLGGVSYIDMEELQKKDYTMGSLDDLYGLVGGWNGGNLWGQENNVTYINNNKRDLLDTNDNDYLPVVIIDGVKRPSNNVLPSEIEQITFLKGAQAVVLYGAKAAKGVILITTKRGTADGLQIKANANTGFYFAKDFPEYLGSAEYMTLYNEARVNDGQDIRYTQMDIYNHASGANPYRYPNVNYYSDEYVRKAYNRSDATVEIQGGGTRAHFYTNINYYRVEDLINFGDAKDNYTDRFSVRGNVDLVINKQVKGFANASATFYNANKNKGDFWGEAATMRPNFPENAAPLISIDMIDPNASKALAILGKSLNLLDGKYFPGGTKATQTNAIADCYFGGKTTDVSRQFQFDAGFVYDMNKFVSGLTFKTLFAIDYAANYSLSYDNKYAVFIPTWSNYNSQDAIVGLTQQNDELVSGHMAMSNSAYRQTITWNGHFDYDHTFAGKHHVTGLLLANMFTTTASGQYHRYANANLGLQAGYDYKGRYFAEMGLAGVHSARLPEGNREAISHSFTLGWNIAKESFMKGTKGIIDDLMISASYSNLNEDMDVYIGDNYFYRYDAQWSTAESGFSWNEGKSTDRTYSTVGSNPALDFIHRKEFSLTLRGSFLNKLISAELTYFNTDMDGFIIKDPTDFPSHLQGGLSGSSFKPSINHDVQNRKGLDFSITAQKKFGQVHAKLGLVGTYLKTENKKYDELVDYDYQKKEGQPLDAIWGYNCVGFYSVDDFNVSKTTDGKYKYTLKSDLPSPKIGGNIMPGDLKYEDVNGDKVIDSKDQVVLGKSGTYGAPWTIGLNLTLKYKNWTLFMLGNGQFGAKGVKNSYYYNNPRGKQEDRVYSGLGNYFYMSGDNKYSVNARGRWTADETAESATHPRLTTQSHAHNEAPSTFWLYSTDRFNLRKVQLTYDFPKEMFNGKWVQALSVYINGNDLLTFAKERKLLETSIGSAPQTRFYNLGVKVTF